MIKTNKKEDDSNVFNIPEKWSELAFGQEEETNKKDFLNKINNRTDRDEAYKEGELVDLSPEEIDVLMDRLQYINDSIGPEFIQALHYISQPLAAAISPDPLHEKKKGKSKKKGRLTSMSREQIEKACSRYGFLSFTKFLSRLNSIGLAQKAIKGELK